MFLLVQQYECHINGFIVFLLLFSCHYSMHVIIIIIIIIIVQCFSFLFYFISFHPKI